MSFYNPYMKGPDWGQGISDVINDLKMKKLIEQIMGGQQGGQQPNAGIMAQARGGSGQPGIAQGAPGANVGQWQQGQGLDPQMIFKILMMMQGQPMGM